MKSLSFFTMATVLGLTFIFAELSSHPVQAATYYVDDNCPGPENGTEAEPFCTIHAGINAASSGDTVQVAAGTYIEKITMKSGVVIQGAGQGISIIDGQCNSPVVTGITGGTLDGFTITGACGGFNGGMYNNYGNSPTVTNCTFSGNTASLGGGMYNDNGSSPTVTNCTFSGNSATRSVGGGGGMWNGYNSSPTVTNCTFSGNTAIASGGGMYNVANASPTVTNCTFSGNTANASGGGMWNGYNSSPTVTNCTFSGNTAIASGGGMYNYEASSPTVADCTFSGNSAVMGGGMFNEANASPALTNCTFSENTVSSDGGGMFNYDSSSPTVTNCIFSGNLAGSGYGGGMFNYDSSSPTVTNCTFSGNIAGLMGASVANFSSSPTVTNCILWGSPHSQEIFSDNSFSVTYSNIQSGYPGTGNIDADPLFVDPANGDFHLQPGSPCIDTGDNSAPSLPAHDFEGDDRIIDGDEDGIATVDMGIDEFTEEFPWILFYPAFIKKK